MSTKTLPHPREFSLPAWLEQAIAKVLDEKWSVQLTDSTRLADSVLRLSDYYTRTPGRPTPWHETWCQLAYLSYYLPLNFLRNQAVLQEAERIGIWSQHSPQHIVDFGSGLGAASLALHSTAIANSYQVTNCESAPQAIELHQALLAASSQRNPEHRWQAQMHELPTRSLLLMSYALTELASLPKWAEKAEAVVLLEPATREQGRKLLELRAKLTQAGWSIWAPCTHQGNCPLLTQSPQDWCHDRLHFKAPKWFLQMEDKLPIKNKTLTFSYLVFSRKAAPDLSPYARLTGDHLDEKGKSRQLVCHGPEREFLAWMHKSIEPQILPRGELIHWPANFSRKANEIRLENLIDIATPERQK